MSPPQALRQGFSASKSPQQECNQGRMGEELVAFRDLSLRYGGHFNQRNASSRPNRAVFRPTNRNETDAWLGTTLLLHRHIGVECFAQIELSGVALQQPPHSAGDGVASCVSWAGAGARTRRNADLADSSESIPALAQVSLFGFWDELDLQCVPDRVRVAFEGCQRRRVRTAGQG